jgi:hypothetical protein
MYKIDNFLDFLLEKATSGKARIYYSDKLREIFKEIKFRDKGNIVSILLNIENKEDYLDSYTLVDVTDKNDTISFIQVNRIIRGEGWSVDNHPNELSDDILNKNSEYWKKTRTDIGLGRWATRVINEVYNKTVLPSQVSRLVDFYRSIFDEENVDLFEVVSGEEIKKWYLEDNYARNIGHLGNSCMKHNYCQTYFHIYTENPEVCKLLIYYNDTTKTKILGRSLLWELKDGSKYQDRIYASYDSDKFKIQNWAEEKGYITYPNLEDTAYVQVKAKDYIEYPYMDTFLVYNRKKGLLSNIEHFWPEEGYIKIRETDGTYVSDDVVFSEHNDEYISKTEAVKAISGFTNGEPFEDYFYKSQVVSIRGVYYNENITSWSSTLEIYVLNREKVNSRVLEDILDPQDERVIKIYQDRQKKYYDYTVIDFKHTWAKEGDTYYDTNFYIDNPYGDGKIFYSEEKGLRMKIENELNISTYEDMINIVKNVYESKEYDAKYIIDFITNDNYYKGSIQGVYWGFDKDQNIKPEDLVLGALTSCMTGWRNNFAELSLKIDEEIGNKYLSYNKRSIWLFSRIKKLYDNLDYSKISDKIYKLYLYNKILN